MVKVRETNPVVRVSAMQIAEVGHDPKAIIRALFAFERFCPTAVISVSDGAVPVA